MKNQIQEKFRNWDNIFAIILTHIPMPNRIISLQDITLTTCINPTCYEERSHEISPLPNHP